jgi:hypothetical protein
LAQREKVNITAETEKVQKVKALVEELKTLSAELSEDELSEVAGGGMSMSDIAALMIAHHQSLLISEKLRSDDLSGSERYALAQDLIQVENEKRRIEGSLLSAP